MAQQYYSFEEAARALGISTDELNRLREKGEIRAFADRGTWKFRKLDIDEAARKRGLGSDPEISMTSSGLHEAPADVSGSGSSSGASDSGDQILLSEQELGGGDPDTSSTIIGMTPTGGRAGTRRPDGARPPSDSDVRIVSADRGPRDSDVKLVFDKPKPSASPRGATPARTPERGAIPNAQMPHDPDSDFELGPTGAKAAGDAAARRPVKRPPHPGETGIAPAPPDSSDITLSPGGSGIGVTSPADSGISLEQPIDLVQSSSTDLGADSSGSSSGEKTATLAAQGDSGDIFETDFEVPLLADSGKRRGPAVTDHTEITADSDFELGMEKPRRGRDSSSQVIALEGEDEIDESAATALGEHSAATLKAERALEAEEEEAAEELGLPPGVLAADVSAAAMPVVRAAAEAEWGALWVSLLGVTAVFVSLGGMMMYDLIRNMWSWHGPNPVSSQMLDWLKGLM